MIRSLKKIALYCACMGLFSLCSQTANDSQPTNDSQPEDVKSPLNWEIGSYNFGGMEGMGVKEQIALLRTSGYDGLILRVAKEENFEMLPQFLTEADQYEDFKIQAAFVRYNFDDDEKKERWVEVVDQIANRDIQLWVIFGKKIAGYDDLFIENKLTEIVEYASAKNVDVVLYPHSSTYFESVEEGLPLVEKFKNEQLSIAFHLYHEIRANNGHRIHEVLEQAKDRLGAVTLAGTDSVADYSSPLARDTSTIKPIGRGTFDLQGMLDTLNETGYAGPIGVMNFSIKSNPDVYLPQSAKRLSRYIAEIE